MANSPAGPLSVGLSKNSALGMKVLEGRGARTALMARLAKIFPVLAKRAAGFVVKTQMSGSMGPQAKGYASPNKQLKKRRSGIMAKSVEGDVVVFKGMPTIRVGILRGPAVAYAGAQHWGTQKFYPKSPFKTIVPVRAKALAIPTKDGGALTPAGVDRYGSPRRFPERLRPVYFARPLGPNRNIIGKLVRQSDFNAAVHLALHKGKYAVDVMGIKAVYLLAKSQEIKPGLFILHGVANFLPEVSKAIANEVRKLLAKPAGGAA